MEVMSFTCYLTLLSYTIPWKLYYSLKMAWKVLKSHKCCLWLPNGTHSVTDEVSEALFEVYNALSLF